LEKFRRHVHAAHSVRSRQKCSIFCLCKSARRAPTTWRAIVPYGPNFHHGRRDMTARHLSTKNRPENAALKRCFAAEAWAMPEDGPPMEGGLICERWLSVEAPPVTIPEIRPHSGKARLRRR
jgi:hypothetical protein